MDQLATEQPLLRPSSSAVGRPISDNKWKALAKYKKGYTPSQSDPEELHFGLLQQGRLSPEAIQELLDESSMISDEIVNAYLELLKHSFGQHVQGLHSPAVVKIYDESLAHNNGEDKLYVQILHSIDHEHYVTVAFDGNVIHYYDTLKTTRAKIPNEFLVQMGFIARKSTDKSIIVLKKNVEYQKGANNCGLYALAIATELCATGAVNLQKSFAMTKLRRHTAQSIINGEASPFPKLSNQKAIKKVEQKVILELLCICNLPQEYDICTMQCQGCDTWYHPKCINHPLAQADGDLTFEDVPDWICKICEERNPTSTTPLRKSI